MNNLETMIMLMLATRLSSSDQLKDLMPEVKDCMAKLLGLQSITGLEEEKPTSEAEPIRGIRGLADFLKVSTVTAQKIKNSHALDDAIYHIGRNVYFNRRKVEEIISSGSAQL